jgi:hypothetical protein
VVAGCVVVISDGLWRRTGGQWSTVCRLSGVCRVCKGGLWTRVRVRGSAVELRPNFQAFPTGAASGNIDTDSARHTAPEPGA